MRSPIKLAVLAVGLCLLLILEAEVATSHNGQRCTKKRALHKRSECAWRKIDLRGDDEAFIDFLSIDRRTFEELVPKFTLHFAKNFYGGRKRDRRGRMRKHCGRDALAATLLWLCSEGEQRIIGLAMGKKLPLLPCCQ
jgi:hypothetical protein